MQLRTLAPAAALAVVLATPASAAYLNGAVTFDDGFDVTATTTSIVSQLVAIDVGGSSSASGCSTDFLAGCGTSGNYAQDFDLSVGGGPIIFSFSGFTFTVDSFDAPTRTGLDCDRTGMCSDQLSFTGHGFVNGNGFADTAFDFSWSATAGCSQNSIATPIQCQPGTITANWIATATALGVAPDVPTPAPAPVPEPGTLALAGVSLAALGLAGRRRRRS
jgi:hypothetical protein